MRRNLRGTVAGLALAIVVALLSGTANAATPSSDASGTVSAQATSAAATQTTAGAPYVSARVAYAYFTGNAPKTLVIRFVSPRGYRYSYGTVRAVHYLTGSAGQDFTQHLRWFPLVDRARTFTVSCLGTYRPATEDMWFLLGDNLKEYNCWYR